MIPGKRDAIIFACLVLALLTALFSARRTKTALQEEAASLRTEVQRLTDEASSLRLERSGHLAQTTITQENHDREVARLRAENAKLRESIVRSQTNTEPAADKSPSPAIKARYIPPDAIKRGEYSFNGYTSPYSTC